MKVGTMKVKCRKCECVTAECGMIEYVKVECNKVKCVICCVSSAVKKVVVKEKLLFQFRDKQMIKWIIKNQK